MTTLDLVATIFSLAVLGIHVFDPPDDSMRRFLALGSLLYIVHVIARFS